MLLSDGFFSVDGVKCENDLLTFLIRLNPDHTIFNLSSTYKCNFLGADNKQ